MNPQQYSPPTPPHFQSMTMVPHSINDDNDDNNDFMNNINSAVYMAEEALDDYDGRRFGNVEYRHATTAYNSLHALLSRLPSVMTSTTTKRTQPIVCAKNGEVEGSHPSFVSLCAPCSSVSSFSSSLLRSGSSYRFLKNITLFLADSLSSSTSSSYHCHLCWSSHITQIFGSRTSSMSYARYKVYCHTRSLNLPLQSSSVIVGASV